MKEIYFDNYMKVIKVLHKTYLHKSEGFEFYSLNTPPWFGIPNTTFLAFN